MQDLFINQWMNTSLTTVLIEHQMGVSEIKMSIGDLN